MQMLLQLALIQDLPQPQGPDLTRYFAVLGGVAIVLVMTAYGLKKVVAKGGFRMKGAARSLEVLEVLPLGSRRQMAVVRCYDRTFALGLGEKNVSMLAELDADMIQHERAKAAGLPSQAAQNPLRAVLKPQSQMRARAKAQANLQNTPDDGFERLLDRAQHQLEAKRAAEGMAPAAGSQRTNNGLEELC
ncbi:MAG: flagellar biosynthetic protein FliO [Planctomycetes bacterium]|nr:flagellar biosynthetic protein FliO [Planctomycetota bacterium]